MQLERSLSNVLPQNGHRSELNLQFFKGLFSWFIPNSLFVNLCQWSQRFGDVITSLNKMLIIVTQAQKWLAFNG
jgi:hypothetical protein